MRLLFFIFSWAVCVTTYGQKPALELNHTALIGVKQMGSHGILLLKQGEKGGQLDVQRISADLRVEWTTSIPVQSLRGYHFNEIQLHYNENFIYWVHQLDESVSYTVLGMDNGDIIQEPVEIPIEVDENSPALVCLGMDSSLYVATTDNNLLQIHRMGDQRHELQQAHQIQPPYSAKRYRPLFFQDSYLYAATYSPASDHSKIELLLQRADIVSRDTLSELIELELDFMSFTYNSTLDKELLSFLPAKNGFYALGKLDYRFNGAYPTTKLTEAFVGFWIAKFNVDLQLQYFTEVPFQYFDGMVNNDQLVKAAVLDLKEDVNGTLLLTISEMKEVLYGHKYLISLDSNGVHKSIVGGKDAYHFFEYDRRGLRNAGKKCKTRLVNDDWRQYNSSALHMIRYIKDLHSPLIANIKTLSARNEELLGEEAYTFFEVGKSLWLLEYLDTRGGTLRIYSFDP